MYNDHSKYVHNFFPRPDNIVHNMDSIYSLYQLDIIWDVKETGRLFSLICVPVPSVPQNKILLTGPIRFVPRISQNIVPKSKGEIESIIRKSKSKAAIEIRFSSFDFEF